jgi:hypothetical protein
MDEKLFELLTELTRGVSSLQAKMDSIEKSNDAQKEDVALGFRDNEHLIRENALAVSKLLDNQKNIEYELKSLEIKFQSLTIQFDGYERRLKLLEDFRSKIIGAVLVAGVLGGSMSDIIEFVRVLF